ncbi:hypothetical protein [Piscibacillus halophilus]|uniref:YlaH-like protein n=1 Tax=Piscibacillus halophilus TaxID=571933 RepID=A0A1H9DHP0_9BACI|nr:hypothetical protein [Piscibacillus halophilus]SEQ12258.1 hypothetical protein SAMN05216362_1074 [Piscibacillus halophilus]
MESIIPLALGFILNLIIYKMATILNENQKRSVIISLIFGTSTVLLGLLTRLVTLSDIGIGMLIATVFLFAFLLGKKKMEQARS